MRPRRCAFLASFACGIVMTAATNPSWLNKEFKDWSRQDALSLLTGSPWAKNLPMPSSGRPAVMVMESGLNVSSPPPASLGNPANTTTGANMSVPSVGGSDGPANTNGARGVSTAPTPSGISPNAGAPEPPSVITVVWASAAPVRLAVLKLHSGADLPTEAQVLHALNPRPHYVIAVFGLPPPEPGSDPKRLAPASYLSVKGKPPLPAADSDFRRIGNSNVYFFRFERSSLPLSLADSAVEFKSEIAGIEIKKRFDLSQMQYKGQLAL